MNNLILDLTQMIDRLEERQKEKDMPAMVARRLGNIILHMKQLREDLGPPTDRCPNEEVSPVRRNDRGRIDFTRRSRDY